MEPSPASWEERVGLGIILTMLALGFAALADSILGQPVARHLLGLFL